MNMVRIGIIGIGNMGSCHAQYLNNREIPNAVLTAVCDINPARLQWAEENLNPEVKKFQRAEDLIQSGVCDGVMIATPHYDHPPLAIQAFKAGLHVLIEKPAGVYTKQVREMNEVAEKSGKVFGIMFNQRTSPHYQKMKDLVEGGELGKIQRVNWIITDWFRTQSYYDSGGWRATWAGEGGGVLINQCPHNLDLLQWITGMPVRVCAFCEFGKFRNIEVEDSVTAYFEYENGATGLFVTTTGEAPGTNRLEICGSRGKLVCEEGKLIFWRNRQDAIEFNATWTKGFGSPEAWECHIPVEGKGEQHRGITKNWVQSILKGTPLLAPGYEGIKGLTLSNAMLLSTWLGNKMIELPLDEDLFYAKLQEKIKTSTYKKKQDQGSKTFDVSGTFGR